LDRTFIGRLFGLLRYNLFLVCYPLGAGCECLVLYFVAKAIGTSMNIELPNRCNFGFDTAKFIYLMIPAYGVVFPQIYKYLLKQRREYMAGLSASVKHKVK
jgi:hypothetical protein